MELDREVKAQPKAFLPFDPIVLIHDGVRQWLLVLVVSLLCGMGAYVYTDSVYVPVYRTSATMVLTTRSSTNSVYENVESTATLASVFTEILNSSVMENNILDELGLESFEGEIYASAVQSTNLLTLHVEAGDPSTAFRVIKALIDNHGVVTYAVIGNIVLEVLEPPTVPMRPINAVDAYYAMRRVCVLVAGGMFALVVIFAYFRDVVRSKREAEQKLDCWCLAEIRHERKNRSIEDVLKRKKRAILITDPQTRLRYVSAVSKLRRRVEQNIGSGKIVMVTSVMENEGKSTIATNLALAMARKYKRVLLIDGDFHKPACRKILEAAAPDAYVNEVIRGDAAIDQAVATDRLSGLHMLFAHHCKNQDASDLVASNGMRELLRLAARHYDFVVIDMPPMSVAPDPEAVMDLADGSLLVVRQNCVRTQDLNRAIAELERGSAKLLGCVLNDVYTTEVFSGTGYGVGYGRYNGFGKYGGYDRYQKYGRYRGYGRTAEE